jgi:hypothetical protein
MDRLYIRHTVGGQLFFDSQQHQCPYEIEVGEESWIITFTIQDITIVDPLLDHRDELNIFVVPDHMPEQRIWFYTRHGEVRYDAEHKKMIITADSRKEDRV